MATFDYRPFIRIIDFATDASWNSIIKNFNNNVYLRNGAFNESNCIIFYDHTTDSFSFYNYKNIDDDGGDYDKLFKGKDSSELVSDDDMMKAVEPILRTYLKNMKEMNSSNNDSSFYFMVRLISNEGDKNTDLQAEGWHHDYMWAPADYSNIVYLDASNINVKAADFCVYGDKHSSTSRRKEADRTTFGTDTWGPGIGSNFTRKEIYNYYKNFLTALKASEMKDPQKRPGYSIAVKLESNQIMVGKIVDFVDDKIVFSIPNIFTGNVYYGLPAYFSNTELVPDVNKWWSKENVKNKLDGMVASGILEAEGENYKVKYEDWDKIWKIPLRDLNPGDELGFNLLRGKDKFEQDISKNAIKEASGSPVNANKTLIYQHFGKPLYEEYVRRGGTHSGCTDQRYYEEFPGITVKLFDAIIWDNKETWHRSPFIKPFTEAVTVHNQKFRRSFLNIRIIKKTADRPTPYQSSDLDFSQFQNKYLKYKSKYLALKKKLGV